MTSSTRSSSTPATIGIGLLEEAAGGMEPRRSVVLLEEAVDQGAGILVVDDRDHELHGREYRRANRGSDSCQRRWVRCGRPRSGVRLTVTRAALGSGHLTPDLLLAAIRAVARSGDPDATLDELLEICLRAAGADRAAAFLWDSDAGGLASREPAATRRTTRRPSSAAGSADHPVKLAAEERIQTVGRPDADGRVLVAWPIVVGRDGIEEPIGALALEVDHTPDGDAGERVAAPSDLVAVVVDRARLATNAAERIDWAERVANSDALTGLANGRTLQRVSGAELARAARQKLEISGRAVRHRRPHGLQRQPRRAAGDDALREVAAVIMESVRFVDTVARWGGDEFARRSRRDGHDGRSPDRRRGRGPSLRRAALHRLRGLARFPSMARPATTSSRRRPGHLGRPRPPGRARRQRPRGTATARTPQSRLARRGPPGPDPGVERQVAAPRAVPSAMIGIVGAVAPGCGSSVSATVTLAPSVTWAVVNEAVLLASTRKPPMGIGLPPHR